MFWVFGNEMSGAGENRRQGREQSERARRERESGAAGGEDEMSERFFFF